MKKLLVSIGVFLLFPTSSFAQENWNLDEIRMKHDYQHFDMIDLEKYVYVPAEPTEEEILSKEFCIAEDIFVGPEKSAGENTAESVSDENSIIVQDIDTDAIGQYLIETIVPRVNQEVNNVRIYTDENGSIQFEGYGQEGIALQIEETANLIAEAMRNDVHYITLAVERTPPEVVVESEYLKEKGIQELVSVGRSDFNGSTSKRIINVMNGASKFDGHLVEKDEVFSFTDQLGPINASTGYVKELVILGNKVVPEYGGGLCQVSSTSYRSAMLAGMEIVERHNHSYAVGYYEPHGSDATIYVGVKDFKFRNTTDGAILIQTRRGGWNNQELFFHYYGIKPEREVSIFGPLKTNYRYPPANKVTYDSSMRAGTYQTVSHRVTGFDSQFFRTVKEEGEILYEDVFTSHYQARGNWVIRGGTPPGSSPSEE